MTGRKRVLVTGGSGFIAGHCILQLLDQGYRVRTTIRALAGEGEARGVFAEAGMAGGGDLDFVAADLLRDEGWAAAVADADYVLHVASPVRPGRVGDETALIAPAREGTLRVLRAARDAGVRRVVLTSAFHAAGWGHGRRTRPYTEKDWSNLDGPGVDAYVRSKTLAERAAWDFVAAEGGGLELASLLPVAVMGPVMGRAISGSNHLIQRLLDGAMPGLPNLYFPIVDVRDVACAHILAMTDPAAAGERFLLSNGPALPLGDIAAILVAELGAAAGRVPTRAIPDLALRIAAFFNAEIRQFAPELGHARKIDNSKARHMLGWQARPPRQAIIAAATSMADRGLLKDH